MLRFGHPVHGESKNIETFDFLGFTHYWGKTLKGGWAIKRKTRRKRLQRAMVTIWDWCKSNRHKHIKDQYQMLCAKLRGHYQYYGIRSNYKMLEVFFKHVERAWKYWLGCRTRNGYITWEEFGNKIRKHFPLPKPRIVHTI
jgi:hypothetical protein